ncbi:MAG: Hpt domain-containing protein [Candidatus Thiodiazotropha taylori]|nr:Hpt domain-containing protein [Candidatus Thiodiazotropha taylori]MCW4223525.1 Hpt domain-containing protein [Candidatus Thiodiazotropha endolucinida]MCG7883647.1 Hpt domain-containing protein [Candidatus Thiodiazotropha taylori]MCG7885102.1 Hpt domain-containing protein [Candidatus Thiodiazotropha taylori]MCG7892771.1 Hpt domain-containing protein [Candidatus Thiodiazotropha taylori]
MDDLLTKPYLPDQLYRIVSKWTGHLYNPADEQLPHSEIDGDSAIYDQQTALASVANDNKTAELILDEFLEMLPGCEDALKEACSAGDRMALYQTAHKLEGSASTSGASSIYEEAVTLKTALKQKSVQSDQIDRCVTALLEQTDQFRQYFSNNVKH